MRGIPQLYSGEEIAMEGKDDPDNRRDFPGGFPGDSRSAFSARGRTADEQRMWQWTHDWIALRRKHSALRDGRLIDLSYDDDVYVYARQDAKETVIIAINRAGEKSITIPADALGLREGKKLMGISSEATVRQGKAILIMPAKTAVVYTVE